MDSTLLQQAASFWENVAALSFPQDAREESREETSESTRSGDFLSSQKPLSLPLDLSFLTQAFQEWIASLLRHPDAFQAQAATLTYSLSEIFQNTWAGLGDAHLPFIFSPEKGDPRFLTDAWKTFPVSRFWSQTYLMVGTWLMQLLSTSDLDAVSRKQVVFWLKQWLAAIAPSNNHLLNPEVLDQALASGGRTLRRGFEYWLEDWQKGPKEAFFSLTRPEGFQVGENLAITPGKVVFQNELMQLIHYEPRAPKVFQTPLLIVPPWINKFYLFDMRPENSFVRWAIENGHSLFMISWVNPTRGNLNHTFESYMLRGFMPALEAVLSITQAPRANLMGLCVGGNLLACALGYLKTQKRDIVQTSTFLATLMDFHEVGDLGVFLGSPHFQALKAFIEQQGFMDGHLMALTFSLLRVNEMIWTPLVKRYFLGEAAPPLDFLFWNSDPLRIAGPLHLFFLETFFQKNALKEEGGVKVGDVFCNWRDVTVPRFTLASYKDHIAPWKACFPLMWGEEDEFILSTSGHIAGVINPPSVEKYGYWTGKDAPDPETWFQSAEQIAGSWWPHWQKWITPFSGAFVEPPSVGSSLFPAQEDAPGSYVKHP